MASTTGTIERPWGLLSRDERLEQRLEAWLSPPGLKFASPQAEAEYKARVTRLTGAITLRAVPDRVPVLPSVAGFAPAYYGYSEHDIIYDANKATDVAIRCTLEFQADGKAAPGGTPGRVLDLLDYKFYSWPGHGIPEDVGIQFNEQEYMKEDEYDALIRDPSDYWLRSHLPRMMGVLEPFRTLLPLVHIVEIGSVMGNIARYAQPEVQAALEKLAQAGKEALRWQQKIGAANRQLDEMGFPATSSGFSLAPFDALGDTLRGTRGIMRDIYRQPQKLLEALERLAPILIDMGASAARLGDCPIVTMPLHKGADGFMSAEQFRTFYWPTLRKVILGLIEQGLLVRLFAEGSYNSRLEMVRDLPRSRVIWHFDYTDMGRAKEVLGDSACLQGNVPVALIHTGTPEQVDAYCRKLIDRAGKGGGFVLATGAGVGAGGRAENIKAMIRCAREYGVYS
ncbi:MAG: uroporphyrinogen decarboxylase [Chloroflexi bacterium]|nr:uroporphyrinogen decarboxylase [Chloroflexota bacterium]